MSIGYTVGVVPAEAFASGQQERRQVEAEARPACVGAGRKRAGVGAAGRRRYDASPTRPAGTKREGQTMSKTKTLAEREGELQALMASPEGRGRLEEIADGYRRAGGRPRPPRTSVITYILVHERQEGLIVG